MEPWLQGNDIKMQLAHNEREVVVAGRYIRKDPEEKNLQICEFIIKKCVY